MADDDILLEASHEDSVVHYNMVHSPSGYRTLRYVQVHEKSADDSRPLRLKFAAVDVFQEGKLIRLFRGETYIRDAIWLDEERIILHEDQAIYLLNATGGPAQRIFPPSTTVDDR